MTFRHLCTQGMDSDHSKSGGVVDVPPHIMHDMLRQLRAMATQEVYHPLPSLERSLHSSEIDSRGARSTRTSRYCVRVNFAGTNLARVTSRSASAFAAWTGARGFHTRGNTTTGRVRADLAQRVEFGYPVEDAEGTSTSRAATHGKQNIMPAPTATYGSPTRGPRSRARCGTHHPGHNATRCRGSRRDKLRNTEWSKPAGAHEIQKKLHCNATYIQTSTYDIQMNGASTHRSINKLLRPEEYGMQMGVDGIGEALGKNEGRSEKREESRWYITETYASKAYVLPKSRSIGDVAPERAVRVREDLDPESWLGCWGIHGGRLESLRSSVGEGLKEFEVEGSGGKEERNVVPRQI
ncbi:hypothetical protein C8R43DRAFT_946175 [Mycena crocata]|nr:hypothetical protein C8R43DRAFT_946175 [Mycena crocata]